MPTNSNPYGRNRSDRQQRAPSRLVTRTPWARGSSLPTAPAAEVSADVKFSRRVPADEVLLIGSKLRRHTQRRRRRSWLSYRRTKRRAVDREEIAQAGADAVKGHNRIDVC